MKVAKLTITDGETVPSTSTYQQPGWLDFDSKHYSFTEKMIKMLAANYLKDKKNNSHDQRP